MTRRSKCVGDHEVRPQAREFTMDCFFLNFGYIYIIYNI
jgi:hypothetical protein